jgi:two-component system, OmpR family, sensor kinase
VNRRSLQVRTVVASGLAILVALVVVGVGIDVFVARHLRTSLDASLRRRAVNVAQLGVSAPALLKTPGALDSPIGGTQSLVQVVDSRGRLVARSLSLGGRVLPTGRLVRRAISQGRGGYENARLGEDSIRVYVAPLASLGGVAAGGAVLVAAPTHDLGETLATLHLFVFLSALVAALLAAIVVAVLLRRALRPLADLAAAASEIEETGDPRRRLPVSETRDEIGQLAATLNAMLTSLERARENERRFLADASHELRTPLTALRGNVAYLARHGATDDLVAELQDDAERLAQLADDLLVLSREESSVPPTEKVFLDELAREAAEADGAVTIDAADRVVVHGDREALARALANLLENARRYGPEGGRIAITVDAAGPIARLSVTDEGRGLQPYEADRAFQRFWRAGQGGAGSGLGLAIVRATAERHGGRAYAEGARFTIELPSLNLLSGSVATTSAGKPEKGLP